MSKTEKIAAVIGAGVLLWWLARTPGATITGGGVIGLKSTSAPTNDAGVSSGTSCTCADPKPGIYYACDCSEPGAQPSQPDVY